MLTNRMNVTYNMENIDNDFDVFRVEKANRDYYKYNILDSAVYEFKAAAVQWTFGATALVLFRKGEVSEQQFKDSVMQEYKDVRIQKIDLFDSDQCRNCFYYENRLLAQLLINSMRTPKLDAFMYHNLTGKLFYHEPSWIHRDRRTGEVKFIRFLEIVIHPGMYLNLEHKTYRRVDSEGYGRYVIDSKTGEFRKKLKTDVNAVMYEKGSMAHSHFNVANLDITDYEHFRKSKLGVMDQFLRDVKEKLSRYLSIELTEREEVETFEVSNPEKKGISEREYGEMLLKKGVVIVDENGSEKSREMVERLRLELEMYYGVRASVGELSETAYNIRIIHDEEYYAENDLYDPHGDYLKGYIVQHMTEETEHFSNSKGSSPAIKKILQELIMKGDVRDRQISIFDWQRLDSGKEWTFVIRCKNKSESGEKAEHMNFAGKKVKNYYNYYRLKVDRDGKLDFDTFCDKSQNETEDWSKICQAYDLTEDQNYSMKNEVDGLVYSDIDNIHAILLTKENTLPNIHALKDTLQETNPKEQVSKEVLLKAMDDFELNTPKFRENIAEWKYKLSEEPELLTKKTVTKVLNMRTKAASQFNRFLHGEYNIWLDGELRKAEFEAMYQIDNLRNIKYEYIENDYGKGPALVYYVGDNQSKKNLYPTACRVRKVVTQGERIEYEELLPLLAVEFVRNGQYTVVPFTFKYLREYKELCRSF